MSKVDGSGPSSAGPSASSRYNRGRGSLLAKAQKNNASNSSGSGKGGAGKRRAKAAPLPGPLHDESYITKTYKTKVLKKIYESNPKSPLNNYVMATGGRPMTFTTVQGVVEGSDQSVWRCTTSITYGEEEIVGIGDSLNRKSAESLAALSALYQLDGRGGLDKKKEKEKEKEVVEAGPKRVTLSDGSTVDYERARHFMEYYCRRFRFGKPDITYAPVQGRSTSWQADMTVGERRIGFGKGSNKKNALMACYVDVVQYLEQCDADIWKQFLEDVRSGKDLGLASSVTFQADDILEDKIQNLTEDIRRSSLYRNRPTVRRSAGNEDGSQAPNTSSYARRPPNPQFLADKSQRLRERRQAYLENPDLESMRTSRATLPVFTKSAELLAHIDNHDVTICMAATGSGKTTQIPQLILDQWIEAGEGAKCNIICTQPRRIAAISVAERVAKERGEVAGRGSVGYQVRFESKIPEEHGAITYCTTGIFLRKMQTALLNASSRSMDDVTHVIVDEVHERDVDIDLMLVVLKRLLAERRAQKKPIKIVLMSATIDATLFRTYFPDEAGQPAGVVEIPGRAFPVEKHFLDDFVPTLAQDVQASWVFRDDAVRKYLAQELGPNAPNVGGTSSVSNSRAPTPSSNDQPRDIRDVEDLDLPIPLVALTIAHVLRKSQDGHVLVFLPGWDDISALRRCLTEGSKLGFDFNDTSKFSIHLLHSSVPVAEQQAIFDPPPAGVRRVILSTNIAETSVTIPDVVYVVDTARIKEQRYDPSRHISNLVSAWVGSSNLNQRAGRAGRHRPGEYFGILSRRHAEELHPHQTVEMKRVDLENVVMHVKALNFPNMTIQEVLAEAIEPPGPDRVEAAIQSLHMVGALDSRNNLTSLGSVLLQLPVDPRLGRLVLFGSFFRCLDQALTLAALMSARDPFLAPIHVKAEAQARKNSWTPDEFRSDLLAGLRAYREWWSMQKQGMYVMANRFCQDNFLSKITLLNIAKVKDHLLKSLYDVGVIDVSGGGRLPYQPPGARNRDVPAIPQQLDENGDSLPLLAALIAIACQPKFAIRTNERIYRTAVDRVVIIHPSSVNHRKRDVDPSGRPPVEKHIVAYSEKRQNISTGSSNPEKYLVGTTRLDPLTYILFGAYRIQVTARGLECDEWLPVNGHPDVLDDLERLKVMMEDSLLRVFQGITASRQRKARQYKRPMTYSDAREEESGDEDDADLSNEPLSETEVKELGLMTTDIVRILDHYSSYRVATASRHNSRPGTPMDSPALHSSRLPWTGHSTGGGMGSTYSSRPGTPSRLSRRF